MPDRSQGACSLCAKPVIAILAMLGFCAITSPAKADNTTQLTLKAAIRLALDHAPALAEARSLENAAHADLAQARRWQNPELGLEAENLLGNGDYQGTGAAEVTLGLTQPFELPGKRKHRLAAVAGDADLSHQQTDSVRVDIIHGVTAAYVEAAVSQKTAQLMQEQLALAESVYKSVARKVDAGKEPPFQERKARIDLANARMAAQQTRQQVKTARQTLQSLIGDAGTADLDISLLEKLEAPRPVADYIARTTQAPVLRSAAAAAKTAEAQALYAGIEWLPDPAISLGVRDIREDDSQALVLGVAMPLPLANRNKAGALAAQERASAASAAQRKARQELESEVMRIHAELVTAYETLDNYRAEILPAATAAANLTRQGYEAGKFQYIEMLDTRRMLADTQQAENNALLAYHLRKADLERLTGHHDHHATEAHQ